ncbi:basic leucine zipper and W2 domain-containing protein 2 [Coprinopsis marcescibilis]|uniref:Basic leucine zipper and W2 domain-containing protein 2 n=1 Tax=Coprinopsis marcescibilis TaxID=230819 RepID=A0A5C3KYC9_COPMA|nr:basic leucine zipper and W2 domain-containing protein 2 [Coprinopsis marcescibilis]
MSQQPSTSKPSLQGVRIKARKGAVKAQAKHEPAVFRDQLYKYFETVQPGDFDAYTTKLIQAGGSLEFLKYADVLFEIILVGGLLQPGGSYVDDGAPTSPFTLFHVQEPVQTEEIKQYIEVLNKLIRRYKYLQKPLEESSLPSLLQYVNRWSPGQKDKLCVAVGLLMATGLANASSLASLTKDHLVKNDVAVNAVTIIFRSYLSEQTMDHLSATLKRGGIKDLTAFFPPNKRESKNLEEHFKKEGLPQVAEWWTKKQYAAIRENITRELADLVERGEAPDAMIASIKTLLEESPIPETEIIGCIWQALMTNVDWSARADQIEGLALREVTKIAPILEAFTSGAKSQVALINSVQIHCYEDTRIMKAFPQILKVLYNKDVVSDQAIIYWQQKGSKPQGRQHFVKAAEPLVKFLQEEDSEEEEDEEK